jgi:hypothetical protein
VPHTAAIAATMPTDWRTVRPLLLELLLTLLELFTACADSPIELYWVLRALAAWSIAP